MNGIRFIEDWNIPEDIMIVEGHKEIIIWHIYNHEGFKIEKPVEAYGTGTDFLRKVVALVAEITKEELTLDAKTFQSSRNDS